MSRSRASSVGGRLVEGGERLVLGGAGVEDGHEVRVVQGGGGLGALEEGGDGVGRE
jgi:hypothetical protein